MNKGPEIGLRVREAREKTGLSLSALAKRAAMSLSYVSLLEAGRIPAPTVDRLSRIATVLGTPLECIISETEYSPEQRIEQHTGIIDELVSIAPNTDAEIAGAFVEGLLHLSREEQAQVADLIAGLRERHRGEQTINDD